MQGDRENCCFPKGTYFWSEPKWTLTAFLFGSSTSRFTCRKESEHTAHPYCQPLPGAVRVVGAGCFSDSRSYTHACDNTPGERFDKHYVSIHCPPRGERHTVPLPFSLVSTFQSTPPRGERLFAILRRNFLVHVSIHAPTRGATCCNGREVLPAGVSIHAPTRGATVIPQHTGLFTSFNPRPHEGSDVRWHPWCSRRCCFNPRPHEGSDEGDALQWQLHGVSIHAPTRGATHGADVYGHDGWFQSTPPRGERQRDASGKSRADVSIHAPTRGATSSCLRISTISRFNPRPHEGSDTTFSPRRKHAVVSIHAPTRGATQFAKNTAHLDDVSIHAPTRGAT